jgi:hypothetical protein
MRELLTGLLLVSCLLPIAAGGLKIVSNLPDAEHSRALGDLQSAPLWTSTAVRLDVSQQSYERLPAIVRVETRMSEAKPAQQKGRSRGMPAPADLSADTAAADNLPAALDMAKAQEWCAARYRSFNPSDNTYQPYGGGPRRVCAAPLDEFASPAQQVADAGITEEGSLNATWCMERYSSYRAEDNTYQPFSGERKQCPGPGSRSAGVSSRAVDADSIARF